MRDLLNLSAVDIVQSDTTVYNPPLVALDILVGGTLVFEDNAGLVHTVIFPASAAGTQYPYRFWCTVVRVLDTGTTLTDAQLLGIKN